MSKIVPQVKSITTSEIEFIVTNEDIQEALHLIWNISITDRQTGAFLNKDPIAVALKQIGKYRAVFVGWRYVTAWKGPIKHEYSIINNETVAYFLRRFDRRKPVEPITVHLFFEKEVKTDFVVPKNRGSAPREKIKLGPRGDLIS